MSTDVTENPAAALTGGISPEMLKQLKRQIDEHDAKLDRSSGSLTSHKNVVESNLIAEYHDQYNENVSRLVDHAQELEPTEARAAFYFSAIAALEDAFGDEAEALLTERAKERAEQQVPLSEDEETKAREERKILANQWKAAYNLMEQFGFDLNGIEKPKTRRGSKGGKREPRQLSRFDYKIGGVPIEKNGLGPIASTVFGMKVSELKKQILAASDGKLDLSKAEQLPDEWEVVLPHPEEGQLTLSASRQEKYREDDEDETEDVEVSDDDEDTEE